MFRSYFFIFFKFARPREEERRGNLDDGNSSQSSNDSDNVSSTSGDGDSSQSSSDSGDSRDDVDDLGDGNSSQSSSDSDNDSSTSGDGDSSQSSSSDSDSVLDRSFYEPIKGDTPPHSIYSTTDMCDLQKTYLTKLVWFPYDENVITWNLGSLRGLDNTSKILFFIAHSFLGVAKLVKCIISHSKDENPDSGWDLTEMEKSCAMPNKWAKNLKAGIPYSPEAYPHLHEAIKDFRNPDKRIDADYLRNISVLFFYFFNFLKLKPEILASGGWKP